jgi:hypothetical protein
MRKAATYLLIAFYSLTLTEFHQLLKIPALVEHYVEHHQEDPSLSLLSFLKMHYPGKFLVDDDYSKDQQLPFRSSDCSVTTAFFVVLPATQQVDPPNYPEPRKEFLLENESAYSFLNSRDIFQPPRLG